MDVDYFVAQVRSLLAEVYEEGYIAGYAAGRKAEAEFIAAATEQDAYTTEEGAYNDGYEHGHAQGFDEGYNEGAADSYDDGYNDGLADGQGLSDAASRGVEEAFDEQPRIHRWPDGAEWD
jgi:flagellar biosynthesis/type III secretory pathway protein FliH